MSDALASDGLTPTPGRPQKRRIDVRAPELSLFDFPLRKAAEAQRDAEFVAPVLETPTREILGMVWESGSIESQRAAVDQLPGRAQLQARILEIIGAEGPQTDPELERRAEFKGYAPSTVRKRRSELKMAEKLVKVGRRDGCAAWDLAKPQDIPANLSVENPEL